MTTHTPSSTQSFLAARALLLLVGSSALGCAAEVGGAPLGDAPYDVEEEAVVGAVPQALELDRDGAYVLSQSATESHRVITTYNSRDGDIYVERTGRGYYTVHLQHLEKADGTVQVVAYGTDPIRCKVNGWPANSSRYPDSLAVQVRCHGVDGRSADSRFQMLFLGKRAGGESADAGWAWTSSSSASHTAHSRFSAVGSGSRSIPITRIARGQYSVRFQTSVKVGTSFPLVTAYGGSPSYCTISDNELIPGVYGVDVGVHCFDQTGALTDNLFTVLWTNTDLNDFADAASVFADRQTTAEYTPSHQFASGSLEIEAYRSREGSYSFDPLELRVRAPFVSARATNGSYCKVASRGSYTVNVYCYDEHGDKADTEYYGTAFEAF